MKFTFNSIIHQPGKSVCQQGIKKYQYAKFARDNHIIAGGNGSYVTLTQQKL